MTECPTAEELLKARLEKAEKLIKDLADYIDKAAPSGSYWENDLAPRVDEFENQWGIEMKDAKV